MQAGAITTESVLGSLPAGVIAIRADGAIEYANDAAAKILGNDDLVGAPVGDVLVPLNELAIPATGNPRREARLSLRDGTLRIVGFRVSPPSATGARTVLFEDISASVRIQKEHERFLQTAALGDALPSILHDLRNPLAAVTGSLEVLVEESTGEARGDLETILWEVRRMNLTLQGVGGLVRSLQVKHHASIDQAVKQACSILEPAAARRGIALRADVPPLPQLPLDGGVVSGVVFNLVKNSIDACRHGDSIAVHAMLGPDDTFTLVVTDSGSGMTAETLAQCRDLFFTSKEKGSGIGLALCQRVAESSGGRLDITSAQGRGTTVTLTVPLHTTNKEERSCHASTA